MIKQEFTDKLSSFLLSSDDTEQHWADGNKMLLQLSGNRIMFNNISRDPLKYKDHIRYQLNKYLSFRLADITHAEVEQMSRQVEQITEKHLSHVDPPSKSFEKGKRADHDSLPDEIQALYVENMSLTQRLREVHLKLRSLSLSDAPCPDSERYPFLKELIKIDKQIHENWKLYDSYTAE